MSRLCAGRLSRYGGTGQQTERNRTRDGQTQRNPSGTVYSQLYFVSEYILKFVIYFRVKCFKIVIREL